MISDPQFVECKGIKLHNVQPGHSTCHDHDSLKPFVLVRMWQLLCFLCVLPIGIHNLYKDDGKL